jgi:type IV pilus assembly protein PilW
MRDTTFSRSDMRSTIAKINHISFTVDETNENLTVEINGNSAQTVVGGIENVQFEYGVDTDGDLVADYFADISSVVAAGDEDDIAAVKISVLAVSGNSTEGAATNIVTDPQTFTFDGTDITLTSDNRYRAVFNSTVVLRNRMN